MLNWIKFWIIKVVKIMSIFLRGLDLSNGNEVVATGIEMNTSDLILNDIETNNITAKNTVYIGNGVDNVGTLILRNNNDTITNIETATTSTESLLLTIENTKATLEDGDILVYNTANSTFKVDNISNYAGGGTGNYHVLVVDFLENEDYATTTIVPEGAIIDRFYIDSNGLTNGIEPLIFSIGGTSNIVLATQGLEFDNTAQRFNYNLFNDGSTIIVGTGEAGTFRSNWSGAGFGTGNGKAYLFYWTPLP
jgi:hypothetical protein